VLAHEIENGGTGWRTLISRTWCGARSRSAGTRDDAQAVRVEPPLGDLPVLDLEHRDPVPLELVPGRVGAEELAPGVMRLLAAGCGAAIEVLGAVEDQEGVAAA